MTGGDPGRSRAEQLARQLQPTPDCVPIERFGETLTERERGHLAACTRCQAELALWRAITNDAVAPGGDTDVQWVTSEVRGRHQASPVRRGATPTSASWFARSRTATLIAAAASLLVLAAGYLAWNPEPTLREPGGSELVYRTVRVEVLAPTGDLRTAPRELTWVAIPGAVSYDVRVFEVDGTTLWRASSSAPRIDLPDAVVAQFAAGRTIVWDVTARDRAGALIAASGTQRFRVLVSSFPRRH